MTKILYLMTAALITSCNGNAEHTATEAQEKQGVFDPMTDQLEKAKKVEAAGMQHKDAIDEALESADAAPEDDGQ